MQISGRQTELFALTDALPQGLAYQADFITAAEEAALLAAIRRLPLREALYKEYTAKRRIMSFASQYDFDNNELLSRPQLAPFLEPVRDKVANWLDIPSAQFSQALVSEYQAGTALGWHRDVPNFEVVVGISLGGWGRMRFRPYPPSRDKRTFGLELEPRSAYVLRGDIRWRWQHSIPATKNLRYSITFRTLSAHNDPETPATRE
jgi:alkylated DNA repair dioxygenase AlkB